jgi:hypothetical protein
MGCAINTFCAGVVDALLAEIAEHNNHMHPCRHFSMMADDEEPTGVR